MQQLTDLVARARADADGIGSASARVIPIRPALPLNAAVPMRGSTIESASGRLVTSPVVIRSSGMRPRPSACTARGENCATAWPAIVIVPAPGASMPEMTSASARWPLPETPAMPRISPARTDSDTSRSAMPA